MTDTNYSLEDLMADPDLVRLCELQRTGDDIFDVINLTENQHSDIIGWMFDPREGHGQGDSILKDFLIALSIKASLENCKLDGRGATSRFFKKWSPSRIRSSSFGSAFYARELGMKASERVDIFVIDPQNKFILIIENKSSLKHEEKQLTEYRDKFIEKSKQHKHLNDYDHVFIALNRDYEEVIDDELPCAKYWIHIGYDWLKISAERAAIDINRGNSSAKLVASYCNRQTDWESDISKECTSLAAILHQKYPGVINELIETSYARLEQEWLQSSDISYAKLYLLQNKSLINLFRETKGMVSVKISILSKIKDLKSSNIEHGRVWINICPTGWEQAEEDDWPVFFNINYSDSSKAKFNIRIIKNTEAFKDKSLIEELIKFDDRFSIFNNSQFRRISIEKNLSLHELINKISSINERMKLLKKND